MTGKMLLEKHLLAKSFLHWHWMAPGQVPYRHSRRTSGAYEGRRDFGRGWTIIGSDVVADDDYDGLRSFLAKCEELDELQVITGADWNLEIGALSETTAELIKEPKALMFDEIVGYPKGYRVLSLPTASVRRMAVALGLPPETPRMEIVRKTATRIKNAPSIPPEEVESGPIMENVMIGDDVDLYKFPSLYAHKEDGGRYIGTGDYVINRDPESGYVNMGTYRIQLHEKNLLGLWQSPGQQGRLIAERYWSEGKSCPIVAVFGGDPLVFFLSYSKFGWGVPELNKVGGMRGAPLPVIKGPLTGLPIPAHAEIAIEGEVPPPDVESHVEGPFGEWPGYYSASTESTGDRQPVIRVKAIYHRNDPILMNMAPQWPGAPHHSIQFIGGLIWEQLDAAGVPGIAGVYHHNPFFVVVSIKQMYAGHAKQVGMATLGCSAAARNGRYVVIVDEDIDPSNMDEVIWAMCSRVDPIADIQTVDNCWATPLDPRMPPELTEAGPYVNSRAVFYAVRPFAWRDKFPKVNRISKEEKEAMIRKYQHILPFTRRR
jgi:UbiD family decarboxylase